MKKKYFRKKVYRQIGRSESINVGKDRSVNGFGYTIIPNDIDRDDYLKIVYQTGFAMIITSNREIFRDVKVPKNLIDKINFPQEAGVYGDLVSWSAVPELNQLYITGSFSKPGEFYPYLENVSVERYKGDGFEITRSVDGNIPLYSISVDSEDQDSGGIEFRSKGGSGISRIRINTDGNIELNADNNIRGVIEEKFELIIGTEQGKQSKFCIEKDKGLIYSDQFGNVLEIFNGEVNLKSPKINLAKANQSMMLGDQWKAIEEALLSAISKITVLTALGPSSVPVNNSEFTAIKNQLKNALSKVIKVE